MRAVLIRLSLIGLLAANVVGQSDSLLDVPVKIGRFASPLVDYGIITTGRNRHNTDSQSDALPFGIQMSLWVGARSENGQVFVTNGDGSNFRDSVRGRNRFRPEWSPLSDVSEEKVSKQMRDHGAARFTKTTFSDEYAFEGHVPMGLAVRSQLIAAPNGRFLILLYEIENRGVVGDLRDVYIGLKLDGDIPEQVDGHMDADNDRVVLLDGNRMPAMVNANGDTGTDELIGLTVLSEETFHTIEWNRATEANLDDETRYRFLSRGRTHIPSTRPDDYRFLVCTGPYRLARGERVTLVAALIQAKGEKMFVRQAAKAASYYRKLLSRDKLGKISDGGELTTAIPDKFALLPNFPNPFNPTTEIRFDLAEPSDLTLRVYNTLGQEVKTIAAGLFNPGRYSLLWDGTDQSGRIVASGIYFSRLQLRNGVTATRKMMLLK